MVRIFSFLLSSPRSFWLRLVHSGDGMAFWGCRVRIEKVRRVLSLNSLAENRSGWVCVLGAKRHLLSDNIIRLQEFQQRKVAVASQIYGNKDQYFKTIEEKLKKNELILKDELKTLLYLCQTPTDVELAKKTIYRFGPLFVRLCYELELEETALELVKDQVLKGFFSESTSFNIIMDMLFIKGYFDSALEAFLQMKRQGIKFTKETYTLVFGICYKLNTEESYRICNTLLEEAQVRGDLIPRHAYCFAVAFALKQNDIAKAQSVFSQIMNAESKICLNLKVLLLAMSGAVDDLVEMLEISLTTDVPKFVKKLQFSQEVLTLVREKVGKDAVLQSQFEDIFVKLQISGQVTVLTLDSMLCRTPSTKQRLGPLLDQRRTSRRTFRPLQSALLVE
ncbi:pentatricopeptide repeat-containing protein 2, mitochondrial isoform X2 [Latimeria chalumnae]|uniref:pentatricopeptide repeat-containing protein 2, mitochondrial isoform X2 n=1 Tax=Latimeria chalumnae TaxID=7897 RepID=UPI0003C14C7E|nr:PREDICTED: pentatricopeptide repeat-containing protein 2, mitochondrial isoform X2 [Latimeria chalumnae]|eukprot:XP_005998836.1 PREDICTED: pentatricopeptide repeat-containing protein 2, mitochondrial isoform X2 [Latimeria chalumnae]